MTSAWDYIVIGSGAAGAIVASRLSEDKDRSVLLLEAGELDNHYSLRVPGLGFMPMVDLSTNWAFMAEPSNELDGRALMLMQGKVLGGSSSINGMLYTRGHPQDFDMWTQMGCEGWSFEELIPFFKMIEASERGESAIHGGSGAVSIRQSRPKLAIFETFLEACRRAGHPAVDDLNAGVSEGFGYSDVNIARGRRMSVAAAYLRKAASRSNLTVRTGAEAQRVLFDDARRAIGARVLYRGRVEDLQAKREVIVSAGAIKSPQLLMLSGVGPAAELAEHEIDIVVDAPMVGKNLQNHPLCSLQYACKGRGTAYDHVGLPAAAKAALQYVVGRRGPLAESPFAVAGYLRTDPALEAPDIHLAMVAALSPMPAGSKPTMRAMLPKQPGFSLFACQGSPYSRGDVRLRSPDPRAAPSIRLGYFSDERDIFALVSAIRQLRAICQLMPREKVGEELSPGADAVSDSDLAAYIRATAGSAYHQSGTCAMGGQPTSVLDSKLRVRGVERLRVADASIIPVIPNAGLHASAMMIGEKAAAMIHADR